MKRTTKIGRPLRFTGNQASHIAALVKSHGQSATLEILKSEGIETTLPTIRGVCKRLGVKVKMGRRPLETVTLRKAA